ncbi:MAG: hypothetical protein O3B01_04725 [Planctomycetota bacterium]|nr:hypothetical protein [Planctomycetota bacterium]MDA1137866.1 hypothetical protein [Planctomycetota bacterium]
MTKKFIAPCLIILTGIGWLLNTLEVLSSVDWLWTLALAGAGIAPFFWLGLDRFTFIVGLFLIGCSTCSLLRQVGKIDANLEVPILVILFGFLSLLAEVLPLKKSGLFAGENQSTERSEQK